MLSAPAASFRLPFARSCPLAGAQQANEATAAKTISELIRLIFYGRMSVILSVLSSEEAERLIAEPLFFKRIVKW